MKGSSNLYRSELCGITAESRPYNAAGAPGTWLSLHRVLPLLCSPRQS